MNVIKAVNLAENPDRRWIIAIILILAAAAAAYLASIRKDLPYFSNWDEPELVRPAVRMASTNDLNPRWFGHPGSTVIYPLAALYRFSHFAPEGGQIFSSPPKIQKLFEKRPGPFYLSGRLLMVLFALGGIYAVYLVGRIIGGPPAGVLAAWFVLLSPLLAQWAGIVRTDSASLLFTLLSVYMLLRLIRFRRRADHLLAGLAVGLAIATKYSLGSLVVVLIAVEVILVIKALRAGRAGKAVGNALIGLAAVPAAFLLVTPYFLAELKTVRSNLRQEMRTEHLGQDGLSFWGNLWWYLGRRIPRDMGWPRLAAALGGLTAGIFKRDGRVLLCAGTGLVLLLGISSSSLHWARWLVPILPLLYLLAAYGVVRGFGFIAAIGVKGLWIAPVLAGAVILLSYDPAARTLRMIRIGRNYSTSVQALKWVEENIPPGSCLVQEWWTFQDYSLDDIKMVHELNLSNQTIEHYLDSGCRYLLANGDAYSNFLLSPDRYPREAEFYRRLLDEFECLAQFSPGEYTCGPFLRIFRLPLPE